METLAWGKVPLTRPPDHPRGRLVLSAHQDVHTFDLCWWLISGASGSKTACSLRSDTCWGWQARTRSRSGLKVGINQKVTGQSRPWEPPKAAANELEAELSFALPCVFRT